MNETGLSGLLAAIINRSRTKKALKRIAQENNERQGITRYRPSQIEAFFEQNELIGNMAFSGGLNANRVRAAMQAAAYAYLQGYFILVLHSSDGALENAFGSNFDNRLISIINTGNPVYDPFWDRSTQEISRIVLASTAKGFEIKSNGKYYLDGISDFLAAKGVRPYCRMFITCPHLSLIDKVNDAEATGRITNNEASKVLTQILQGECERGNIEYFFSSLQAQAGRIIAEKKDLHYAMNIRIAERRKQILVVDLLSSTNILLLNLLMNEVEELLMNGRKVMVIADNIPQSSSNAFQSIVKRSNANCSIVLTSDDVFATFNGEDTDFYSFAGKCSKIVLSKHSSAYSCQKWSDFIGSYDKQEVNETYSQNANFIGHGGLGSSNTVDVRLKRESIVKPEDLQRISVSEAFILDKNSGEIAYTQIV